MSPYTWVAATTRSPADSSVSSVVAIAAIPDDVMNAASASSRRATSRAATSTVGLRNRPYQISSRPPAWTSLYDSSSRKYVTDWWIGGTTGRVRGLKNAASAGRPADVSAGRRAGM